MTSDRCEQPGGDGATYWHWQAAYWRTQAESRAAAEAELETRNAALRVRVAELEAQVAALAEKVVTLTRLAFGESSEKRSQNNDSGKGSGPDPVGGGVGGEDAGEGLAGRRRGQRRGSAGHGRRDYSHLPTREEVHDVPEGERVCPCCGAAYAPFGEECCEQIDWQVQLTRIVHRRVTYRRTCRCAVRGVLVAPPVPKAIAKGRFTTGFLARLLCEKFVLGRPAHRIVAALAHDGLHVAEGTLAGVFAACSQLLAPSSDRYPSAHQSVPATSPPRRAR